MSRERALRNTSLNSHTTQQLYGLQTKMQTEKSVGRALQSQLFCENRLLTGQHGPQRTPTSALQPRQPHVSAESSAGCCNYNMLFCESRLLTG